MRARGVKKIRFILGRQVSEKDLFIIHSGIWIARKKIPRFSDDEKQNLLLPTFGLTTNECGNSAKIVCVLARAYDIMEQVFYKRSLAAPDLRNELDTEIFSSYALCLSFKR